MFAGLAKFFQFFLDAIVLVLNAVCRVFPPSPFTIASNAGFGDLLGKINFFLPIYEFVAILEAWLVGVVLWYAVVVVARWVKAVE